MDYVEVVRENRKWISGVFLQSKDAENYFQLIPEGIKNYGRIKSVNFDRYPVYLVESEEFYFVDLKGLHQAIIKIEILPNFKYIYINIYEITEDFVPKKPGTDYMGILKHAHVNNEYLERYQKFGGKLNPFD